MIIGKYKGQNLVPLKVKDVFVVTFEQDKNWILGLSLNFEPKLTHDLEVEEDTIHINSNDKFKIVGQELVLYSNGELYPHRFKYTTGQPLNGHLNDLQAEGTLDTNTSFFDGVPYRDYLFSALTSDLNYHMTFEKRAHIRDIYPFKYCCAYKGNDVYYKVGNLIIKNYTWGKGEIEAYLISSIPSTSGRPIHVKDYFSDEEDYLHLLEVFNKDPEQGPWVLTDEGMLSVTQDQRHFRKVDIKKNRLDYQAFPNL